MTIERFGLSAATLKKIQCVLAKHPSIERAILYGSRAKGNYKRGSDIDLTLCGSAELNHRVLLDVIGDLDDLLLPYSIDLSIFSQLNHAELREHIERVGVVFYRRDSSPIDTDTLPVSETKRISA